MWSSIFHMWVAWRGRRAVVAAVGPLVERSRCRLTRIPELAWLDPYMVGFLVMLISFVAKREVRGIDSQALGLVQIEAWAAITGMTSDLIGEEVLLLSISDHGEFNEGCRNAISFGEALYRSTNLDLVDPFHDRHGPGDRTLREALHGNAGGGLADDEVAALWSNYFDAHVASA